jgi:hypothetical protein
MNVKSILKPEGSVVSGMAVSGGVLAIYALQLGPVNQSHASDPNHPVNESSRKKAAVMSFLFVAALTVITKDANVGILGWGTQVAADVCYRHAIMVDPVTGQMVNPGESAYLPAANTVPLQSQGQSAIQAGGY